MKALAKLIIATLLTILTATILSTQTYAASSVDVYCDGLDDQEKISAVLANDTTINIYGDCVFSHTLFVSDYDGIVLQGDGSTTVTQYSDDAYFGIISFVSSKATVNNLTLLFDPSAPILDGKNEGFNIDGSGSSLTFNNVVIDGFNTGVAFHSTSTGNTMTANGLVIINVKDQEIFPGFMVNIAIGANHENDIINWISGRSDADIAIGVIASETSMSSFAQRVTIDGDVLSESDFIIALEIFEGFGGFGTIIPINRFVNCGFPVGSQYDICPDTDGGEEPGDGDNGNEIEAPGTGVGGVSAGMIVVGLLIVGCGAVIMRRARL